MFFSLMHNQDKDKKEGVYFYAIKTSRKLLKIDFVRFCMVGVVGFAVNYAALFVLYELVGLPILAAQLLGAETALFSNFIFHHFWTYRGRTQKKRIRVLLAQFHMSFWAGALINSSVVVVTVWWIGWHYFFGLVAGSLAALFWNFFWTKFYIWRHSSRQDLPNGD